MQAKIFTTRTVALLGSSLIATALVGCSQDAGSAPAPGTSQGTSAKRDSYELVSVVRPASMEQFVKRMRLDYEVCVGLAELSGLPFKPFPAIPPDYVKRRSTHISDGKSFAHTEVEYGITRENMVPEKGCETHFTSVTRKSVVRDGFEYVLGPTPPGEAPWEPVSAPLLPYDDEQAATYTIPQKIKGIALKCQDSRDPVIASGMASDSCIVDPAVGKIAGADGEPFVVNLKDLASPAINGGVLIHEAESLKVGIPIDAGRFSKDEPK